MLRYKVVKIAKVLDTMTDLIHEVNPGHERGVGAGMITPAKRGRGKRIVYASMPPLSEDDRHTLSELRQGRVPDGKED